MNKRKYYTKTTILIKTVNLEQEKLANAWLSKYSLTFSQFKTLRLLAIEAPSPVRQVDIEQCFSMTNPTVTSLLHNLEKNGWIERVVNPEDSRSKLVGLSKKAKAISTELEKLGNDIEAEITKNLTEKEKKTLMQLLLKMVSQD